VPGFSYVFPRLRTGLIGSGSIFAKDGDPGHSHRSERDNRNHKLQHPECGRRMNIATIYERDCTADTNGQICVDLLKINDPILNGRRTGGVLLCATAADGEFPVTVSNTWEAVAECARASATRRPTRNRLAAEAPSGAYVSLGAKPFKPRRLGRHA
jgi:hypothetical protein